MQVSAYIPCYNNDATIARSIQSVQAQSIPISDFFVIDDASSDNSAQVVREQNVVLLRNSQNLGRGAVRARAMSEAQHEFVLACDATIALPRTFLERALPYFEEESVAAVFGRVVEATTRTTPQRWRARHLFKNTHQPQIDHRASLSTGGVLMRKSLVLQAGNFNPQLRQGEDRDLGSRLLQLGHQVTSDPGIHLRTLKSNSIPEVLERYWRWNHPCGQPLTLTTYLRQIVYSLKVMARADLRHHDPASAAISLLCPHYLLYRSNLRRELQDS